MRITPLELTTLGRSDTGGAWVPIATEGSHLHVYQPSTDGALVLFNRAWSTMSASQFGNGIVRDLAEIGVDVRTPEDYNRIGDVERLAQDTYDLVVGRKRGGVDHEPVVVFLPRYDDMVFPDSTESINTEMSRRVKYVVEHGPGVGVFAVVTYVSRKMFSGEFASAHYAGSPFGIGGYLAMSFDHAVDDDHGSYRGAAVGVGGDVDSLWEVEATMWNERDEYIKSQAE